MLKSKILFVIPTLGGGGAERVVSYISSALAKYNNYDVHILLLREEGNTFIDKLPSNITIHNLKLTAKLQWNVLKIVGKIISLSPNICFVGLDALNLLLSPFIPLFKIRRIKLIIRETNVLSLRWKKWRIRPVLKLIYKLFYNRYDIVVCQSDDMLNDLVDNWSIKIDKLVKINNPVNSEKVIEDSHRNISLALKYPYFVSVGRLHPQKGYDTTIKNIARLESNGKFPFHYYILGEGILHEELKQLIQKYRLEKKIILLGYIGNPYPIIAKAKGILLSSLYEGFPNVLLEANALGIPILANDCLGGINEIVVNGKNGFTTNYRDFDEFEKTYDSFISTQFMTEQIIELNQARFDSTVIIPQYVKLFNSLLNIS